MIMRKDNRRLYALSLIISLFYFFPINESFAHVI